MGPLLGNFLQQMQGFESNMELPSGVIPDESETFFIDSRSKLDDSSIFVLPTMPIYISIYMILWGLQGLFYKMYAQKLK